MSPFIKNFKPSTPRLSLEKRNILNFFKNTLAINICLIIFIFIFIIFYLIKINFVVAASFRIKDLENKVEELKKTNRNIQLEKTQLESLNTTQESMFDLQLVQIDKVEYLKPLENVALSKSR